MLKKFILLATSVLALLALVAPAAQATGPLITNSEGKAAKTITAASETTVTHTEAGTLECKTVNLDIGLTSNAETTAQGHAAVTWGGNPKTGTHFGACGSSANLLVDVTAITITNIHLTKHGGETAGTASFSYTYDLRMPGGSLIAECTFGGTTALNRTGPDTVSMSGSLSKTAGSAFCPSAGTITGSFTLRDESGSPVTIH